MAVTTDSRPARWTALLSLLLVVALCWQLASWTWIFLPPGSPPAPAPPALPDSAHALETVRAARLFGAAPALQPGQVTAALNLRLSGVFAATGALPALAIIRVEGKGDLPYMTGDKILPDVVLEQVRPDHVLLRRGAATERLDLAQKPAQPAKAGAAAQVGVRAEGAGKFNLSRAELSRVLSDPAQLAGLGHFRTVPGQGVGVAEAGTDSLLGKLGLQKGDVIRSVNNRAVEQAADLLQVYREQLGAGGVVKLQGTRNGQPFEYNYALN